MHMQVPAALYMHMCAHAQWFAIMVHLLHPAGHHGSAIHRLFVSGDPVLGFVIATFPRGTTYKDTMTHRSADAAVRTYIVELRCVDIAIAHQNIGSLDDNSYCSWSFTAWQQIGAGRCGMSS
jgi:hypothetical protein